VLHCVVSYPTLRNRRISWRSVIWQRSA
jgi:hypothetical protein